MRTALAVIAVVAVAFLGYAIFPTPTERPEAGNVATVPALSNPTELPFVQGGTIALQLQGGDYKIIPSSDDKIVVTYTMGAHTPGTINVNMGKSGSNANVKIATPNGGNFHIEIAVPAKTNLYARLSAGNLDVEGIEGSKDVENHAGNVKIDVGDPDQYRNVYAAVSSGNLQAQAWSVNKPGLMRSFSTTGKGPYGLHARVGAGNLILTTMSSVK